VARNQSLNPLKISNTPPLTPPLPFCVRMPLSYFEIWTDTMKMIFYLYIRKNAAYSVVECEGWAVWPGARRPERATLAGYAPKVSFLSRYSERYPSAISLLYSETTKVFKQCHDNGNYYYYPTHTNGKITTNIKKIHYTTPPITYAANNNNIAIPRNNPSVWNWHHPHSNESAARNTLPRQEDHPTPIIILMTIIYPTASHRTLQSPNKHNHKSFNTTTCWIPSFLLPSPASSETPLSLQKSPDSVTTPRIIIIIPPHRLSKQCSR